MKWKIDDQNHSDRPVSFQSMDACKYFLIFSAIEEPACVAWHLTAENYPFPLECSLLSLAFSAFLA